MERIFNAVRLQGILWLSGFVTDTGGTGMLEIELKFKIKGGEASLDGFVDPANLRLPNA
jgi:hypothetical protein